MNYNFRDLSVPNQIKIKKERSQEVSFFGEKLTYFEFLSKYEKDFFESDEDENEFEEDRDYFLSELKKQEDDFDDQIHHLVLAEKFPKILIKEKMKIKIQLSKTTSSVYVVLFYKNEEHTVRFSDHKKSDFDSKFNLGYDKVELKSTFEVDIFNFEENSKKVLKEIKDFFSDE